MRYNQVIGPLAAAGTTAPVAIQGQTGNWAASLQIITNSLSVQVEGSNDGVNWAPVGSPFTASAFMNVHEFCGAVRYFRLTATGVSGSCQAILNELN